MRQENAFRRRINCPEAIKTQGKLAEDFQKKQNDLAKEKMQKYKQEIASIFPNGNIEKCNVEAKLKEHFDSEKLMKDSMWIKLAVKSICDYWPSIGEEMSL